MKAITSWLDKVLVPEWRKSWRMLSVIWSSICAAAGPVWLALPDEKQAAILTSIGINPAWVVAAAFVVSIALRLKAQGLRE